METTTTGKETTMSTFKRVAAGDYETADGRYRMYQIPDVRPPAWNVEDVSGESEVVIVDGAASKRDAIAIFEQARASEPQTQTHRIRHYVYAGDQLIPRERSMQGAWPCEAKCSCGWETRTGGAVRSWIEREVADHKLDVRLGLWTPESN